ncbi:MAG TPA: 23S rRNA (guanosine(2251)-2'-O)-methyltransferase RlmB [Limnochorda sp.]
MEPRHKRPVKKRAASGSHVERRSQVEGRQAVLEMLRSGRPVDRLLIAQGSRGRTVDELVQAAEARGVRIEPVEGQVLDGLSRTGRHQGVIAIGPAPLVWELDDLLRALTGRKEALILACDQVQDPQNVGALVRSADAAGADGVVVPARRNAALTPAVERAAAGATSYLPWVEVVNLARALGRLQEAGFWVIGLDAAGEESLWEADLPRRLVVVVGSEGTGLRPLVRQRCDRLVRIPMRGHVGSLNVSVAGALCLFEVLRRRMLERPGEGPSPAPGGGA